VFSSEVDTGSREENTTNQKTQSLSGSDAIRTGKALGGWMVATMLRPAVFFDRDGVLNRDFGFVHRPEQIEWIDGAKEAVRACNQAGAFVFVVSNQSGVARGMFEETAVVALHAWMRNELAAAGAHIDDVEFCPHLLDGSVPEYRRDCRRRKPAPGMILDLLDKWPVDRARSLLIGDKASDVAAAEAAGIAGALFPGGDLHAFLAPFLASRLQRA
jgi:D-glycero-D-manno-heptose 1,7-bisphosphate phosphatase